jgi:hypothetical protein
MSKNTKIALIALILVSIIGLLTALFFGFQKQQAILRSEIAQLREESTLSREETETNVEEISKANTALVKQNEDIKKTLAQQQYQLTSQEAVNSDLKLELLSDSLYKDTMSRIVLVSCNTDSGVNYGSGGLQGNDDTGDWVVYTNLHVLGTKNGELECYISIPEPPNYEPSIDRTYQVRIKRYSELYPDVDFAVLEPLKQSESFNQYSLPPCTESQINIGDKLIVFGYPGFGGSTLTVTEGIVSGIESTPYGNKYKTSAKIDSGNSGGLALSIKERCGIGLPTWAQVGSFEGLGYIQSWEMTRHRNISP